MAREKPGRPIVPFPFVGYSMAGAISGAKLVRKSNESPESHRIVGLIPAWSGLLIGTFLLNDCYGFSLS